MKPSRLADLLKRYLQDDTTETENWTVDQWYEARDLYRPTPAEQAAAKARAWQRIQARTRPAAWQRPAVRWAMAATLALGLGLGWLGLLPQPATVARHRARPAGQLTVTTEDGGWQVSANRTRRALPQALADGSTVTLQPGSWLRYPTRFAPGQQRVVELRGEAFFAVFHETRRRFRVLTPQLETTVLGTSFTVRAVPGEAEATVQVRTGAVAVRPRLAASAATTATATAVVVRPNQQVVYSAAVPTLRPVLVAEPALLRPQPLRFDERPVAEVLASLQAGYGVPIRYDGAALAGCTVSVSFGAEDLFGKLDLLCKILGASYERVDDTLIFRSRGCQSE